MKRIPEPELMNEPEQAAAYAAADFATVNQAFVDRFLALAPGFAGSVVDLGCGPGDIALRLCQALPGATVTGVDGASEMLLLAERAATAASLTHRVTWHRAMLPDALPGRRFDAVISNSLLHHLPEGSILWSEVAAVAAPGAIVLVVDLLRPDSLAAAAAMVDEYARGEPDVLRTDFYNSLLAAFSLDEVGTQLAAIPRLAGLELAQISDRHLAVAGRVAS